MIVLSSNIIHPLHKRARFFFGGIVLIGLSIFVLFASSIYNMRIATSDTELIANAVIVLFCTDLDEMIDAALIAASSFWTTEEEECEEEEGEEEQGQSVDSRIDSLKNEHLAMKRELEEVNNRVERLCGIIEYMEIQATPNKTHK
jgi:hypothetical protein